MSTDLLTEARLPLTQLAHEQGVSIPTVWRWTKRGIRGVRLETIAIGGRRYTTSESFARFVAATNSSTATRVGDRSQRQAAIERAEREFTEARS